LESQSTRSPAETSSPAGKSSERERIFARNRHPSEVRRWYHFFAPSAADVLFATLLLALSGGAVGSLLLRDGDTGWHIRNGELILRAHALTRIDPFSSTMNGRPWYDWEWLYDVLVAAVHHALGLNGVVFFTAALAASVFALVLHLALRRGGNIPISLALSMLALVASTVHLLARPHIVSWLFAAIWFDWLDSASTGKQNNRLFWLPAVMVLWVNLHSGFLLGLLLLGVYLVGGAIEHATAAGGGERSGRWLQQLGLVTLLSLLASLINPFGYRLYIHVFEYLSNSFLMNRITEFLSPNFHGGGGLGFIALLSVSILVLAGSRQKISCSQWLVVLFALSSGLYAARNLPVSSILLTLIVAPLASTVVGEAGMAPQLAPRIRRFCAYLQSFADRMGALELNFRSHFWLMLGCALGLWICLHGGKLGSIRYMHADFDRQRFPVESAQIIADRQVHEPIFCPDAWGGYLIYRLYPQTKVVVDDRHDLYGERFFKNYLKVVQVEPDWEPVLNGMQVNWVVAPANSALATIMKVTPPWTIVHQDATSVLFFRAGSR
jgi:hypothetical protein